MTQVSANIEELKRIAAIIASEQTKIKNGNSDTTHNVIPKLSQSRQAPQHPLQHPPQHPPQHPSQHPPQHPSQHYRQQKNMQKVQPNAHVAVSPNSNSDVANIIQTKSATDNNSDIVDDMQIPDNQLESNDNMLGIFGFYIPKQTLYLLIVLVMIAIGIWYMSYGTKQNRKKKEDNDE